MKRILVANRGEIAQSAIRCFREMGMETVAVCSDVEPDAIHVRNADLVQVLPGGHISQNYNSMERILECAHCGLNVPESDGVREGGRFYCCNAHRLAGPRAD